MLKRFLFSILSLALITGVLSGVVSAVPTAPESPVDYVSIDGTKYYPGQEITSERERNSRVVYQGDGVYQAEFAGSPEFTRSGDAWVEYVFSDMGDYYKVQHPWSSVKFYDYYTEVWNEEFTEVKIYDDRWVVEYQNKQEKWKDSGFWNITRSYEVVSDGIKLKRTGDTAIGQREEVYFFRNGSPCKIEIRQTCDDDQTIRFVWKPSGVVASTERNIVAEDSEHKGRTSGINYYDAVGAIVQTIRWFDELDACSNIVPITETHAKGRKATITFGEFNTPAGQTAILDPETFYPDAHEETTSVDGFAQRLLGEGATWADIRTGAGTGSDDTAEYLFLGQLYADEGIGKWRQIIRGAALFDTSPLSDDVILTAATLTVYGRSKEDSAGWAPDFNVYSSDPASDTEIIDADYLYTNFGTTAFATAIAYADLSVNLSAPAPNTFTLNASGLAAISLTDVSKFGFRTTADAGDSPPAWFNVGNAQATIFSADKGEGYKPKLTVTYTFPPPPVTTLAATSIEETAATLSGNITACGDNWTYRKTLTFDNSASSENLTDIAVPVLLNSANFTFNQAQTNGEDIRFTDADGTPLSYLVSSWNATAEEAIIWVNVPQIDAESATDYIYMYWGNEYVLDAQNPTNVFINGCVLAETYRNSTSSSFEDATAYSNNGTFKGVGEPAWSQLDSSLWVLSFDGTDDYVSLPSSDSLRTVNLTYMGWVKSLGDNSDSNQQTVMGLRGTDPYEIPVLYIGGYGTDKRVKIRFGGMTPEWTSSDSTYDTREWHFVASTFYNATKNLIIYVDGIEDSNTTLTGDYTPTGAMEIGARMSGQYYKMNGYIALPRVNNRALSAEEIEAQYNQQKGLFGTPDGYITFSAPESGEYWPSIRGFEWDIDSGAPYANDWYEDGSGGAGVYSHGLTALTKGELYYFRAYATNTYGTGYGSELKFLTKPDTPYDLAATTSGNGTITLTWSKGEGAQNTYIRGKAGSYPADRADGYEVYNDTGTSVNDTGLTGGTTYYYRAWSYATEGGEEQYSDDYDEGNALALSTPSLLINTTTGITLTEATASGNITSTGGYDSCDYRGFVWGTSTRADPGDTAPGSSNYTCNWTESGAFSTGSFTHELGISENTTYYLRSCAHTSMGWAYSTEATFKTYWETLLFDFTVYLSSNVIPDQALDNDGIATFRTTSSDLDISASLSSFEPGEEAKAPPFTLTIDTPWIPTPDISGNFTTEMEPTFPGRAIIDAISEVGNTPAQLPYTIISGFLIVAASLTTSWLMRKYGSGSLLVKVFVIVAIMGVLVAVKLLDFWIIVIFLIIAIAMMMASRHTGW